MITNLPSEAQEQMEESARRMAHSFGIPYEDALARLVKTLEAFREADGAAQLWVMPQEGGCEHVHVWTGEPMRPVPPDVRG